MTQPELPSARQAPLAVAAVTPRPAATTLILRDGALGLGVLMVRRSPQASFTPGANVFPGGAVDVADGSPAHAAACDEPAQTLRGDRGLNRHQQSPSGP